MATTDPLQLLANTLSQFGAPAITLTAPVAQPQPQPQPQRQEPEAPNRRANNIQQQIQESLATIQQMGTVPVPQQPLAPQPLTTQEQRLRNESINRSANQQYRQQAFDNRLNQLLDAASRPTVGGSQFIQARDARRLAMALLGSGGLTGFEQLSQNRDADILNRIQADRDQLLQSQTANLAAEQQARTATAQNVSGGAAQLLQQALASQMAGEAAVRQAQIQSQSGNNQLSALQAQIGQALLLSEDDAQANRLAQTLSSLQGNAPPAQELVSDIQQTPVGSYSPATGTFTPFLTVDPETVAEEADQRTRSQARTGGAAGTTVQTSNATTQQLVAKMLGGQPLTAEEQRVLQTQSFNLNL